MICVIIPTYNNAGTIRDVVQRCLFHCKDIIVVNDGSTDDTESILASIQSITVVTLTKNSGKGAALKAGFRKAIAMGFSHAITIDADGQHYPEDIPLLLEANALNPDALIVGERKGLDAMERSGGSKFANAFSNFWFAVQTGIRLRDTQTGYRLYPLKKLYGLSLLTSRYEAELELLVFAAWHGVKIVQQPVNVFYPPQEERVSHFRPAYDFTRIFILNTCLCFLALLYALPLAVIRWGLRIIRTLYSLLFFLTVSLLLLLPAALFFSVARKNGSSKTWAIHRLLHFVGRLVMEWHGIPGVKYEVRNDVKETFSKPAVVICNHQSSLDLMAMLAQSPKLAILTKDWVYNNPFFGGLLRQGEYYPVSEGFETLLSKLQSLVERGYSIMIYPEGTRSPDCRIQRFHKGAFELADRLGLDILPIIEYGPGKVLPKGALYLRRGIIQINIEQRVSPDEYRKMGNVKTIASAFRKFYKLKVET